MTDVVQERHAGAGVVKGRIGPNAIIRTREALQALETTKTARDIFAQAGLATAFDADPSTMVDEADVASLMRVVHETLGPSRASTVGWIAGQRTADYLLAHRIPAVVQRLLRYLPSAVAARVLTRAISQHAYTFAGSGAVSIQSGNPTHITITGSPITAGISAEVPVCSFYAATFERLFRELVHADAIARERTCAATGSTACRFEISWPSLLGSIIGTARQARSITRHLPHQIPRA